MRLSVAVDIGGTFTDLLGFDTELGKIYPAKSLSTPHDFAVGVLDCVKKAGLDLDPVENFVHGTTVAINTAIERTGARTRSWSPRARATSTRSDAATGRRLTTSFFRLL